MVIDAQDLQRAQVDQRVQPLDGVGVVVVQRKSAHPDEAVEDPSALLLFEAEFSHSPRVDAHVVDFGQQASAAQRLLEARIGFHGLLDQQDLFDRDHGPRIGPEGLCDHLAAFEVHAALPDAHLAAPVDVEPGDAGERRPLNMVAHELLLGFLDVDRLDPQIVAPGKMRTNDRRRTRDLARGERVQRVGHLCRSLPSVTRSERDDPSGSNLLVR